MPRSMLKNSSWSMPSGPSQSVSTGVADSWSRSSPTARRGCARVRRVDHAPTPQTEAEGDTWPTDSCLGRSLRTALLSLSWPWSGLRCPQKALYQIGVKSAPTSRGSNPPTLVAVEPLHDLRHLRRAHCPHQRVGEADAVVAEEGVLLVIPPDWGVPARVRAVG
jgi:hypothetical protein